jgi:hypothetical protein
MFFCFSFFHFILFCFYFQSLPIGDIRDPFGVITGYHGDSADDSSFFSNQINLVLLGIALGAVAVSFFLIILYRKLRQEHSLLEKDKGSSLRKLWARFSNSTASKKLHNSIEEEEYEMSKLSLMRDTSVDVQESQFF